MSKIVQKLNRLKNPESFIQINTIKGFKYIDRAGEIVNVYHKKNAVPKFIMGLDGLLIDKPKEKIDQLKITPQIIWAKFSVPDSLDMVANLFSKEVENILHILEVEKISRIGWRNYFIYEFQDKAKQNEFLQKIAVIKDTKLLMTRLEVKTNKDFNANLILQPVIKKDEEKTTGILFDIDLFKNGEIDPKEISIYLTKFRQYLSDEDDFLSLVNDTF
jgi:hypothetical protein